MPPDAIVISGESLAVHYLTGRDVAWDPINAANERDGRVQIILRNLRKKQRYALIVGTGLGKRDPVPRVEDMQRWFDLELMARTPNGEAYWVHPKSLSVDDRRAEEQPSP